MIYELKKMGSENEIGGEALRARLKLYESTIMQALLNNLEGWGGLKLTEIERLESIQCNILKEILELPKSTPHVGLILELGVITIQERIRYKQLMLFHTASYTHQNLDWQGNYCNNRRTFKCRDVSKAKYLKFLRKLI